MGNNTPMTDEEIKRISDAFAERMGEEFERFLNPVYEQLEGVDKRLDKVDQRLDKVDKRLDRVEMTLEEHTDKIDALMAEMHDFHQEFGAHKDHTDSEIDKIKVHIGLISP
jgi:archaellum component FlaC